MRRSSRRWKKYLRSRWKWQRRRIREEKRLRKLARMRAL
jgi:hypothetical protein